MLVSEVIDFAVTGDLKGLSVAEVSVEDQKRPENLKTLINYINLGLISLYKKFSLATQSMTLSNVVDGASYNMPADYLYLSYAKDNLTNEVDINNEFSDFSLFTPSPFMVYVTKDDIIYADVNSVDITYIAVPPLLTTTTDTVPLPYQFLEALLAYMEYKAHGPANTDEDNSQNPYWRKYLGACNEVKKDGLQTADNQSNLKSVARGFV